MFPSHIPFQLESGELKPETLPVRWKKVTLAGVGLLGGSLGLALKQRKLADLVVGFVRRKESIKECESHGAVDSATLDLHEAISGAELVVLCTPIAKMQSVVKQMHPALAKGAIVTDVGSVKGSVVGDLETLVAKLGGAFVGSHPMAGAERMGVAAARGDLFNNAVCIVTPTSKSNKTAVDKVEELWRSVGARPLRMSPELHDELVSRSSHLPHVLAATLANAVLDPKQPKQQGALCANGFRDTTRIASGSPEMWRDIALANRENLISALDFYVENLQGFRHLLKSKNEKAISKFFETAKKRRDEWVGKAPSASPE
jgi:prephenate dehydrogenase